MTSQMQTRICAPLFPFAFARFFGGFAYNTHSPKAVRTR